MTGYSDAPGAELLVARARDGHALGEAGETLCPGAIGPRYSFRRRPPGRPV